MRVFASPSAWLASAVLHATGFGVIAFGPPVSSAPPPPTTVELTVATVAAPPPPPPPEPLTEPPPQKEAVHAAPAPRALRVSRSPSSPPPSPASPAKAEVEAPLDLTGTTLTSDRGDFALAAGSGGFGGGGESRRGPLTPAAPPAPAGPTLARPEDLSRLPAPPELSGSLLAHYPARARAAGETGRATLSLIVYQDGTVGGIEVRSASSDEFARACRETLRASRWSPPVGKDGRTIATRVGYTCHFDVR